MNDSAGNFTETVFQLGELLRETIAEQMNKDPFSQQIIYEKWIKQDDWQLREQAMPLILGVDPDAWQTLNSAGDLKEKEALAWEQLQMMIANGDGPNLINPDETPLSVNAALFYRWVGQQGISVPDALDALMQFVMNVVKKDLPSSSSTENIAPDQSSAIPGSQSSDREKVLGAAFNLVSKEPDSCRDDSGLTNGIELAKKIHSQSVLWFDSPTPPMSVEDMGRFLEKWLE